MAVYVLFASWDCSGNEMSFQVLFRDMPSLKLWEQLRAVMLKSA